MLKWSQTKCGETYNTEFFSIYDSEYKPLEPSVMRAIYTSREF